MKNRLLLLVALLSFLCLSAQENNSLEQRQIASQIDKAGKQFREGQYKKALTLSKNALARSLHLDDPYLIAHSYNSIGAIYDEFSQTERAIEFYTKALQYANEIENDSLRDWLYSNLGSVYYYNDLDVKKGIRYYKKSLYFARKIKDSMQICYTKLNIASAYFRLDDFKSGKVYIDGVRGYLFRKGEPEARLSYYSLMGLWYSNLGKVDQAENAFGQALAIAKNEQMASFELNVYDNLISHYLRFGKKAKAKETTNLRDALSASLYSPDQKSSLESTAREIELNEYKGQLEKIELASERQQMRIRYNRTIIVLLSVILLVLALWIYTLYRNNNARKSLNRELGQANAELRKAKENAEENSRLKSQFIATVSHELRTPLYGIIGITETFLEEHKGQISEEYASSLRFSSRYLLSLVNDVLLLSEMEEHRISLNIKPFSVRDMLMEVSGSLRFMARNSGNEITTSIDDAIPPWLLGDEIRISQILLNLAGNAIKFTKNGLITLSASLECCNKDVCKIRFTVADNGIGIAQKDQQKVFEKFVQLQPKQGDYQGTGLGLSIVQRLLELFGSEIELKSSENEGSAFSFCLDMECAPQVIAAAQEQQEVLLPPLSILVVEDNKINRLVTQKLLERNGHYCDLAEDGFEALRKTAAKQYDVILMDLNMPGIDGFETTKKLRESGVLCPVIALTAYDSFEVTPSAHEAGINDVLIKPYDSAALFRLIARHLKTKNAPL